MLIHEVVLRIALAVIVGGLIGYEREFKNRPAGFRTHILVCVGAAVISMIQLYSVEETTRLILAHPQLQSALKADIGRLGAQVISGIGFLGAGTIIHEKGSVKGLTTAASLWVVACIGLAVGLGYYTLTLLSTAAVFMVLASLKRFEARFMEKGNLVKIELQYIDKKQLTYIIEGYFEDKNIKVQNIEFSLEDDDNIYKSSLYTVLVPRYIKISKIIQELSVYEGIEKVNLVE
ncbi:MgtC/SapB family protein [Haloimpatiens lingqiaonensis]|uniref:MgtC/SapB family protein n=1 Tax=Haloimpatiens lingqiaonensis TaxID=1380675 RepID=UPI0010FE9DBD|nr:MgtC/SapB family protein [Haloimpatiens lingqiaonensis]